MPSRVQLRQEYVTGMAGPAALAAAIIAVSAPTAYHILSRQSLRREAVLTARRAAAMISATAEEKPRLWQYDTLKILGELREYIGQADIGAVVLLDRYGREVPLDAGEPQLWSPAWGTARVFADNQVVGSVAIAMDGRRVDEVSLAMLAVFLSLGLGVSFEMHRRGVRTVAMAEERIRELVASLEDARQALSGELNDTQLRLADLVDQTLALRETERASIARDLHDGVGQVLCGLRLRLDLWAEDLPDGPPRREAIEMIRLVEEATAEVRRASATLAVPPPEQQDLRGAIETMCERVSSDRFRVALAVGSLRDVPGPAASAAYRILQEAIANAARHSFAGVVRVAVEVDEDRGTLCLTVQDGGRGFDPAVASGLGLTSMRSRAEALQGRFEVESAMGAGCTVRAAIPMTSPSDTAARGGNP